MANDEKFLLVSLNEAKAKRLAQVISNDSCRKILDYLADKEGSETKIAEDLKIPISTTHYNLQQLVKAGLVIVDEFHYSKKGKEINHYKLANKYIIIAPKQTSNIKEILKKILPIALISIAGAAIIEFFKGITKILGSSIMLQAESVNEIIPRTMMETSKASADFAAEEIAMAAPPVVNATATHMTSFWSRPSIWFLIGGLTVLIVYLLIEIIKNRKR